MVTKADREGFTYAFRAMEKEDPVTMMSKEEIVATFRVLMIAGSETNATLLSGATNLLLKDPDVLKKLVAGIRSSFAHSNVVSMVSVDNLTYLLAVLEEARRMMPPVANPTLRLVRFGSGEAVGGHFVPGRTKVSIRS